MPLSSLVRRLVPSLVPLTLNDASAKLVPDLDAMRGKDSYSLSLELRSPGNSKARDG